MRDEKGPHEIGGGNVVPADAQTGPHVVAALNGIQRNRGGVLAARIDVGMYDGSFGMLWSGRAAVFLYPEGHGVGYRCVGAL